MPECCPRLQCKQICGRGISWASQKIGPHVGVPVERLVSAGTSSALPNQVASLAGLPLSGRANSRKLALLYIRCTMDVIDHPQKQRLCLLWSGMAGVRVCVCVCVCGLWTFVPSVLPSFLPAHDLLRATRATTRPAHRRRLPSPCCSLRASDRSPVNTYITWSPLLLCPTSQCSEASRRTPPRSKRNATPRWFRRKNSKSLTTITITTQPQQAVCSCGRTVPRNKTALCSSLLSAEARIATYSSNSD